MALNFSLTDEQMRTTLGLARSARLPAARVDLINALNTGRPLVLDGRFRLPRLDLVTADAMLSGNVSGGSLSQPYQPGSPVSYVQYPARGNDAWRWYKQQLYVP